MADKVGDEFDGYVTGVAAFGLFIELVEHFVEGLVHISSMADDYYRFLERAHTLRGENTHKVYRLGDRVRVQVVRVDLERRQIDLGLTEILDRIRGGRSASAGRSAARRRPNEAKARQRKQAARPARAGDAQEPARVEAGSDRMSRTHAAHRRRHRRPHRSRQERARPGADRHRSRSAERREGPRHHDRSRLRALDERRRAASPSSTCPATSASCATCSRARAASTRCCWSSRPTSP